MFTKYDAFKIATSTVLCLTLSVNSTIAISVSPREREEYPHLPSNIILLAKAFDQAILCFQMHESALRTSKIVPMNFA